MMQAKGAKSPACCTQDDDIDTADVETPDTTFMPHLLQQVWAAATQRDRQPLALIVHAAMLESGFLPAVEVHTLTSCAHMYCHSHRLFNHSRVQVFGTNSARNKS